MRSLRAVEFVAGTRQLPNIFNIEGGIMAWDDRVLPKMPNIKTFSEDQSLEEVLLRAMDLEKGAERLYGVIAKRFEGTELGNIVERLEQAEVGHARSLYRVLEQAAGERPRPFEELYENLQGDILESGESFDEIAARAHAALDEGGEEALMEVALDMELKAYDLYNNLAEMTSREDLRKAFWDLAQHEKRHAAALLNGLSNLSSN